MTSYSDNNSHCADKDCDELYPICYTHDIQHHIIPHKQIIPLQPCDEVYINGKLYKEKRCKFYGYVIERELITD